MKNLLIIGLISMFPYIAIAQRHEIGVRGGFSNIVGDIGKTSYIHINSFDPVEIPLFIGASYKRNFNPYQGIKASFSYHSVYFDDTKAKELYRNSRAIKNSNNIIEGAITFEYNFFPVNNEVKKAEWSPYIFGGVSALLHKIPSIEYIVTQNGLGYSIRATSVKTNNKLSGAIPFGVGLKYKFNTNWAISAEVTFRPTFTDELDYNDIKNNYYTVKYKDIPEIEIPEAVAVFNNFIEKNRVGNLNSKDWLNSVTIGLSYSFGRPPCYCD